jgi:predicted deacylase
MRRLDHPLLSPSLGTARTVSSFHFGEPGRGEKAYIQAALHADELPGMLVAWQLKPRFAALEAAGRLSGEIVLVPVANPIGLDQTLLGYQLGRFEQASGENFNRHYPALADSVFAAVHERLGHDAAANTRLIRVELMQQLAERPAKTELASLRNTLHGLAADADVMLDLHCDARAALHLYTGTPLWPQCEPLARYLGAHATLLATESGDNPFDEACSQIWWQLAELARSAGLDVAIEPACLAVTVELRGQADVQQTLAEQDADAIVAFLTHRGVIAGDAPLLPALLHPATPLAGSETLVDPHPGVVSFHVAPGAMVTPGQPVADIVDPLSDRVTTLASQYGGVVYAQENRHYATTGMELAKIATATAFKTGKLLSA